MLVNQSVVYQRLRAWSEKTQDHTLEFATEECPVTILETDRPSNDLPVYVVSVIDYTEEMVWDDESNCEIPEPIGHAGQRVFFGEEDLLKEFSREIIPFIPPSTVANSDEPIVRE